MEPVDNASPLPPTGAGHCLHRIVCIDPPCTATIGSGRSGNRCIKCIMVTTGSLLSMAAHLTVTVFCVSVIPCIDRTAAYPRCTMGAIFAFLFFFNMRLTARSSEIVLLIGRPTQFLCALTASIADTVAKHLAATHKDYLTTLRAIEVMSLLTFVMLGALIASYHYVCIATSGDVTWKTGFLVVAAGTIAGITAPYGDISPLAGFLSAYTALAIHVVRDASRSLMNTCYYRARREITVNGAYRLGRARLPPSTDAEATREEDVSSYDTLGGNIPTIILSLIAVISIPAIASFQKYMSNATKHQSTLTDTLRSICGFLVGTSVAIFLPSRYHEVLFRPILVLLLIFGAMATTLAGFGLLLGPTLFSATAAVLCCYTCINVRNANSGIKQLAAAAAGKCILGTAISSMLVCVLIQYS
ncbi:UL43 protein [Gallid alphaherpesvirus 3]|uniref:UL43 protein n=1 Tax=Gallid alphaherpesvirus 3 TaxID=35250 RepID=F8TC40_9ALPH|nr:UL43 protein [Gallid alphaherpesvirus 3]AEI00251.1 UL43 protein [Gallid alphaherpesvirus 3]QEY02245.1 UL43 protein [Gallid alphaherpesvirus 3]